MRLLILVAMLAMGSLAFAQYECEESCCYSYAGTWDADFHMCNDHNVGYLNCVDECRYGSPDDGSYPTSAEDPYSTSFSCCGPAFMLAGLVGAAVFLKN